MAGEITGVITVGGAHDWPEYSGSYEITPGEETQTLATAETVVTDNIIIKPIPANYGLITWDGSVITVS